MFLLFDAFLTICRKRYKDYKLGMFFYETFSGFYKTKKLYQKKALYQKKLDWKNYFLSKKRLIKKHHMQKKIHQKSIPSVLQYIN